MKKTQASRADYNKSFDKAVKHFKAAQLCAGSGQYDLATPHLILGLEELIKYQVILLYILNNCLFEKELFSERGPSILNDHALKHKLSREFQEATSAHFAIQYLETLFLYNGDSELTNSKFQNKFVPWGLTFHLFGEDWIIPENRIQEFFDLMNSANNTKNDGFYTNPFKPNQANLEKKQKDNYYRYSFFAWILLKQAKYMKDVDMTSEEVNEWRKNNPTLNK
mgnify:CR=1 FL=1